jgi:valyl-tRNA synthetase
MRNLGPKAKPSSDLHVPEKPSLEGLESKWSEWWDRSGTYRFDRSKDRTEIYAIDTPPPTVSGSLHIGHVMSYTHTDLIARFQRMRGREVFYPIGWDDNGLATERRVQNHFGVRCDPSVPYDPTFNPYAFQPTTGKDPRPLARGNFIDLCQRLTADDEKVFEDLFRRAALSVDWSQNYTTIGERARRISQKAFLRLLGRGLAYTAEAPTMWDVDFQTAVAQAEIEDREREGLYHRVVFELDGGRKIEVETSRPELLPACVALVVPPTDERFTALIGSTALTPLFKVPVPVVAHELADPEKGTGAAMVCTFGDLTDVIWWRELSLPLRVVVERDGTIGARRFGDPGWESRDPEGANAAMAELVGLPIKRARVRIAELLRTAGLLVRDPEPVLHAVKYYEKGERPLEVITSRQWFVSTLQFRDRLLARGEELKWHPAYMGARFRSWVSNLNIDWAISRQRFYGVPFPVWYRLDAGGDPAYEAPIVPEDSVLPIDPQNDVPPGYRPEQRGEPSGFVGDPDIMDTWATSSLSPQIASHWEDDPDLFTRLFPMDLRPQAHDIIRTWLFYTVFRAELEHGSLPWRHAAISGFVLDPDRKKMSKSKGNVVVPTEVFERHGADAVRYWAASARLGVDATFDEQQMRVGRRLAIKILNASKFAMTLEGEPGAITDSLDLAMLHTLAAVVEEATAAFEDYDHAKALDAIERSFWGFTDDYLELVKQRAYGSHGADASGSAVAGLRTALETYLRLFAPFLPYVTEEVWSWWQDSSVHLARWPTSQELTGMGDGDPDVYEMAAAVLREVRRTKALAKVSLRTPIERVLVRDTAERIALLRLAEQDVREAGSIRELETMQADGSSVDVALAEPTT